jgi:hypothetical protein
MYLESDLTKTAISKRYKLKTFIQMELEKLGSKAVDRIHMA